jgi:hydroxymethylpyrimidine pyrophosphatase-like HAD family hydrolase
MGSFLLSAQAFNLNGTSRGDGAIGVPLAKKNFRFHDRGVLVKFRAIACDYDSTLAHQGRVAPETVQVLRRARMAGRKLILITGRTLHDLRAVFSDISLFDLIVVENGGLLFDPKAKLEQALCAAPPLVFITSLSQRKVPFSVGKRVVATHQPHQTMVQQVISDLNLELAVILNRESVMVLPRGIDKASGMAAALDRLDIRASEVVGIGDAENDSVFLRMCGFSAAVANAIDSLKRQVDYVTLREDGAGAAEVIEQVIAGGPLVGATD